MKSVIIGPGNIVLTCMEICGVLIVALNITLCVVMVSRKALLSRQDGFQVLTTIRCSWHNWTALSPDLVIDYFIWGCIYIYKTNETSPANTEDLKQQIRASIQETCNEIMQRVLTSCPSRLY